MTALLLFRKLRHLFSFKKKPKVLLFLYMIQDLDLALIISDFLTEKGISHSFLVTYDLAKKSPRVTAALQERKAQFWIAPRVEGRWSSLLLSWFDAFFTIVESTAGPHRAGYALTQRAKGLGLRTYTFQHGLENIGLTYFDEKYNKDNIRFASDTVFIWCQEDRLHPDVPEETRRKCFKSGCPKTVNLLANPGPIQKMTKSQKIVSIFENLHWERYNESYQLDFINNVRSLAKDFPDILFVLKPHHAGQWLTRKYKGSLDFGGNVIVANPTSPDWEPYTGPDLIAASVAVLTTPSTITMDAAILQKPVAVIGQNLDLNFYRPLPILTSYSTWRDFLSRVLGNETDEQLKNLNMDFIQAVTSPGNTRDVVVEKLIQDFSHS